MMVGVLASNQAIDTAQSYSVEDLIIRIMVDQVTFAEAGNQQASLSFVHTAFACDPVPPGSAHHVKAITINSNTAFEWNGQDFAVGEEITNLFRVAGFASDPSFDYLRQYRFNFLGQEPLEIRLIEHPEGSTSMDINLELTLSDDRVFRFEGLGFRVY
ncbi:hypothetical protein GCM10008106_04700 [Mongoliitalea lutea]|uniref:Uncharacterized protein n=2 Tax=Mongoliitalea lutea TaxID=849756 RepID=A0A8J3CUS2_9BACT|nr:hypothetical protein GCM10008106_04700 [Mongoliitalea lutea]